MPSTTDAPHPDAIVACERFYIAAADERGRPILIEYVPAIRPDSPIRFYRPLPARPIRRSHVRRGYCPPAPPSLID